MPRLSRLTGASPGWRAVIGLACATVAAIRVLAAPAPEPGRLLTAPIDDTVRVRLEGNTPPAALHAAYDRGPVEDAMPLDHLLLVLKRSPEDEAALRRFVDALHDPGDPVYHHWLKPDEIGARFGIAPQDLAATRQWLGLHGFTVNRVHANGLVIDFSGDAAAVRETFHTEIHRLVLPNGATHLGNVRDPEIPAALAPLVAGIASLHDFFPRARSRSLGPVSFDRATNTWKPHFDIGYHGSALHLLGPYDFAVIYNLLPLWSAGFTGKGITIAAVEDSNLSHISDWLSFRETFGLERFTHGRFEQIYPGCSSPGQNGDETEAALDVEWASAAAPDAHVELAACPNTATTFGLDLAILGLIDTAPPDIITDSYGLCETITGAAEIALENREAQLASAEGTTFFIAQGDTGADECVPAETSIYATLGVNSGDNTASAYAVDVGGTDFMAQYNADVFGIQPSHYWSPKNDPVTKSSALSYVPEIPWNDGCTSRLIFTDPVIGAFSDSYGTGGFCNSSVGQDYQYAVAGSGGPSTCFTGAPSIPGVVSGSCKGNPKPSFQKDVPGVPQDGLRDQPDISLFAADGVWGSFYLECMSDLAQGGAPCTLANDAFVQGGGGTSFSAPAMAGIQALIDQKFGRQGDANYVYYALARRQFNAPDAAACHASKSDGALPAKACVFHDVDRGDIDIPCGRNDDGRFYDCFGAKGADVLGELSTTSEHGKPAYPATSGYDLATGLGSVDATNLFRAWPGP
jgi:subtilase family serine protease